MNRRGARAGRVEDAWDRVRVVDEDLAFEAIGVAEEDRVRLAEVGDEVVSGPTLHQPASDLLERFYVLGAQTDVVDAPTAEHRHLAGCFRVALDVEDVEHRAVTDVDDRHAEGGLPVKLALVVDDRRLEHVPVERMQAVSVTREGRDVIDALQQHAASVGQGLCCPRRGTGRPCSSF